MKRALKIGISLIALISTKYSYATTTGNYGESTVSSSLSVQAYQDFPNYFSVLPEDEVLQHLSQSMHSILNRLEVPHINNGSLCTAGFFGKLHERVQAETPGAKVYIAAGMIRSILGYIYKKIHNEHGRRNLSHPDKEIVLETFGRIQEGLKRPPKSADKRFKPLNVLGVASDYDILIDFHELGTTEPKRSFVFRQITDFINSYEGYLKLRDNTSVFKKLFVPVGDVKDYNKQFGTSDVFSSGRSAVIQGGSSLDWLAFPVANLGASEASHHAFRLPDGHDDILINFIHGNLQYLPPVGGESFAVPCKQTVRGLRALLELPFLEFDVRSRSRIISEMERINELSKDAIEQFQKMVRNACYQSAKNRFYPKEGMPVDEFISQVQRLIRLQCVNLPHVPEFVKKTNIERRVSDQEDLLINELLMPVEYFKEICEDGCLYHGTPDIAFMVNMIRNGLVLSAKETSTRKGQGVAMCGTGFYTGFGRNTALRYMGNSGIVFKLGINPSKNIRILDYAKLKSNSHFVIPACEDPNRFLADKHNIDIILSEGYALVQNADAFILDKSIEALLLSAIQKASIEIECQLSKNIFLNHVENNGVNCADELKEWISCLNTKSGFVQLLSILKPEENTTQYSDVLSAYMKCCHDENPVKYFDAILKDPVIYDAYQEGALLFKITSAEQEIRDAISSRQHVDEDKLLEWVETLSLFEDARRNKYALRLLRLSKNSLVGESIAADIASSLSSSSILLTSEDSNRQLILQAQSFLRAYLEKLKVNSPLVYCAFRLKYSLLTEELTVEQDIEDIVSSVLTPMKEEEVKNIIHNLSSVMSVFNFDVNLLDTNIIKLFYDPNNLKYLHDLKTKLKPSRSFRIKSTEQLSALIRMATSEHGYLFDMSKRVIEPMMEFGTSADAAHFLSLGAILPTESSGFTSFIKNINAAVHKNFGHQQRLLAENLDRCIQLFKKYKDVDVANSFMSNVGIEPRQLRSENEQTNFSYVLTLYKLMFELDEKINEKDMFREVIEVIKKPGIRGELVDIVAFANEINQHANIDELIFKIHNIAELEIFDKNTLVTESIQMTVERSIRINKIARSFKNIFGRISKDFVDSFFTICDSEKYSMEDLDILSIVAAHHKVTGQFTKIIAEQFLERIQRLPAVLSKTISYIALLTKYHGIDMFFNLAPYHERLTDVINLYAFYANGKKPLWEEFFPLLEDIIPDTSRRTAFAASSDFSVGQLTSACSRKAGGSASRKAGGSAVVPQLDNFFAA